ncbi:hypothetical protein J0J30_24530, partial [Vibrio vulnificus]|nr:hypothetical protein [Vibrio vulnificus]
FQNYSVSGINIDLWCTLYDLEEKICANFGKDKKILIKFVTIFFGYIHKEVYQSKILYKSQDKGTRFHKVFTFQL